MHCRIQDWKRLLFITAVCAALTPRSMLAQSAPPVILEIDLENYVNYFADISDWTKLATHPEATATTNATFGQVVGIADIVAVNGKPAKGTYVAHGQTLLLTPTPTPAQSIADITRGGAAGVESFEILQADGTPVGAIYGMVSVSGPAPPGSPRALQFNSSAIAGGNGAFLGVRGQCGIETVVVSPRRASQGEDPANRRINGGGKMRMVLYLIPMTRPSVIVTSTGPAIVHSNDFTPVTASSPAKGGEILSLFATDLGPVRPGVDPGQPFPTSPLAVVNSPLGVTVSGISSDVIGAVGYPGSTNGYQINFRVPSGTGSGMASVQLSAGWISGAAVSIPVQ